MSFVVRARVPVPGAAHAIRNLQVADRKTRKARSNPGLFLFPFQPSGSPAVILHDYATGNQFQTPKFSRAEISQFASVGALFTGQQICVGSFSGGTVLNYFRLSSLWLNSLSLNRYLAIFAVAALTSACGSSYSSSSSPTPTPTTNSGSTIILNGGVSSLTTNAFGTNPLTVATGTTITWTNRDTIAHTTTSNAGTWNANLAPGASFNFTFTTPGTYPYHCTVHPNMVGTITVQ